MSNQKTIRILIAEDDYLVGKSTAALLRTMGYTVVGQALDGREAVEMTQSLRPDVILMDIKMPVMDGIEATRHIYETCPTPVVALTAYATQEVIERAIAAGVGAYLTKPASVQEIERAINVTIARFHDMVKLRRLNAELRTEIAERKRAEAALRESEERYRAVVQTASDAIISIDSHGGIVFWNRVAETVFGYSADEIVGKPLSLIMPERFREAHRNGVDRVVSTGDSRIIGKTVEVVGLRKDSSEFPLELSLATWKTSEGIFFTAIVRDITERKQAEAALRESEEKYRTILENIEDSYFEVDIAGNFTFFNDPLCRLLGYSEDELMGMNNRQYMDDVNTKALYQTFNTVYRTGKPARAFDWEVIRKDGTRRFVETSVSLLRDSTGEPAGFRGIVRDVTERKQTEEALRESEERYRTLFEQANDAIFLNMEDDTIVDVNRRACEMLGYTREELLTMKVPDLQAPEVRGREGSVIRQELEYGGAPFETVDIHRDGTRIPVEVSTSRMTGGEEGLALAIVRDITERRRAEEEIRQRNRELAALNAITAAMMQSALDLDEVLQRTADGIVEGLGCNTAFIFLLDEKEGVFRGGAVSTKAKTLERMNALIGSPLLQIKIPARSDFNEAMSNLLDGRITIKHDFYELVRPFLSRQVASTMQRFLNSKMFFAMPLLAKGKTVGGIIASTAEELSEADAEKLMTFANQAAIAIENARLYEAERDQRELAEALRDTAETLNSTLDFDEVLDRILTNTGRVVPHDTADILLFDSAGTASIVRSKGYAERGLEEWVKTRRFPLADFSNLREMYKTRQPLAIPDTQAADDWVNIPETSWIRSCVCAPITVQDQVVGFISLTSTTPGTYNSTHAERLQIFANQAAIAIENARLYEEVRGHADKLAALYETGKDITSTLGLDARLQLVAERAARLTGADKSLILLVDTETEKLTKTVGFGFARDQMEGFTYQEVQNGISGWVLRERTPTISEDVLADPRNTGLALQKTKKEREQGKSIAVAPLLTKGEVTGTLTVINNLEKPVFSQDDLDLVAMLASQAATAIENARLYEETRQRALQQETLREAALALTTALDRNEVIDRVLAQLQRVVPYDSASVQLLRANQMELVGGRGFPNLPDLLGISFPADGDNPNSEVIRTRAPFIVEDAPAAYEGFGKDPHQQTAIRSWLGVPMLVGERLVGMIALDKSEPGFYTPQHARLAEVFAAQAAVAIENARLFTEAEQRAAELSTMLEVARAVSSTLDLEQVLALIAEQIAKATGVDGCTLSRWDREADAVVTLIEWRQRWAEWADEPGTSYALDDYPATRAVLEKRQPITILAADPDAEPAEVAIMQQTGVTILLMLPLVVGERVIGLLELDETERERDFTADEIRLCQALADQAAVAIENARLFEEEKRRSTQLALINEVGEKAASILDSDRLMQEVIRSIQESFNYYNVALLLLDEERGEAVMQAIAGGFEHLTPGEYRQSLDEGIVGFVAKTGKSRLASDVSKDPYYIRGVSEEVLTESELCVPVQLGDKVIGVLDMQSVHPNDFNQEDVVVMEAVADRLAIALQNARLYEEMAGLYDVGLAVSSALELGKTLRAIYEQVNHLMSLDTFYIALYDEARGELRFDIFVEEGEWLPKFTKKLDEGGLTTWIVQSRKPLFIGDFEKESPPVTPGQVGKSETQSWLGFPLLVRDKVVGVISVQSFRSHAFTEGNKRILSAFANQAAIAIENSRLFEEIEERRVYLEGVLGAAPDAIVTLDDHFQVVEWNAGAERLFGYSREEAIGQHLDRLVTNPDVFEEAIGFTQIVMGGKELPSTEAVRYRKDGSPVDVIVAGSPILVGDELIGVVAVYTDITTRVRMEETLRALALIDDLTSLYNRRGFVTLGQQQLKTANRAKRRMMLLFADFDGLKQINDAFGHSEGDRALIETAHVLRETFRESDIIARIGGDEFVVLAIETNGSPAEVLAIRFQENLKARNTREDRHYKLSLSVGLARYDPEHPCSIDELLAQADRAMYDEKKRDDAPG